MSFSETRWNPYKALKGHARSKMSNPLGQDLDHVLDHTRDLWDELRGERLFITGGTGFFGRWLLESLLWANRRLRLGVSAVVLTRNPEAFQKKAHHLAGDESIELRRGDVRTFDFPTGTFSHVIHAATESSAKMNEENPLLMLDTIVDGTRHALDFAAAYRARRFLLTSSGAVYGKQPPDMTHIPEDYQGAPDPTDPRSAYGEGKRLAEHLCTLYAQRTGMEMKIARCFAFVGPYLPLDAHFAVGNFIRDALRGGPIIVKGDGTPRRSYLYAADLAIWLWTILLRGQSCRPYNVGSEEYFSIKEVAETVASCFSPPPDLRVLNVPGPGKPVEKYVPATKRARDELKLHCHLALRQAIQRTISH
jgi:nucleoside-diphosphate-sugar epimerase